MELKRVFLSKSLILCLISILVLSNIFFIKEQNDNSYYGDRYTQLMSKLVDIYSEGTPDQAKSSIDYRLNCLNILSIFDGYTSIKKDDYLLYQESAAEAEQKYREQYKVLAALYDANPQKYEYPKYGIVTDVLYNLKARADYISSYADYLDGMEENARQMSAVSIFSKKNSYSVRNIQKTLKDYEGLKGIKLELGMDEPVTSVMNYKLVHYLMLVYIVMLIMTFFTERKQGLWSIVHASSHGRVALAMKRLGILAFSVTVAGLLMYGSLFVNSCIYYGAESRDILRNVQSIEMFRHFVIAMPVWKFIILYIVANIVAAILVALVIWFVLSVISNNIIAFGVLAIVFAAEYLMYTLIPIQSNFGILKCINLFAFIDPTDTLITYRNLNFFSLALNRRESCTAALVVFMIVFSVLCVYINAHKRPVQSRSKFEIQVMKFTGKIAAFYNILTEKLSLAGYELYKVLILQKGIIIIAVVAWYLISSITTTEIYYSPSGNLLRNFYESYSGEPGRAVNNFVDGLSNEINEAYSAYYEAQEKYKNGEIDRSELEDASMRSMAYSDKEDALSAIRENLYYIERLRDERGIKGWLLNQTGYKCLFDVSSKSTNEGHTLIAIISVILLVSGVFSYENKSGTLKLLRSSKGGRSALFKKKIFTSAVMVFLIWLIVYGTEIYDIWQLYGLTCFKAPVQSLMFMYDYPFKVSVGVYMATVYLLRLIQLFAIAGVMCAVSSAFKYQISLLVSAGIFALPATLYMVGLKVFGYFSVIKPIEIVQLVLKSGKSSVWILPVVLVIVIGLIGYVLAYCKWCITGRRKRNA